MTACETDIRALVYSDCTIDQYAHEWERLLSIHGPVEVTAAINKFLSAPAHQDSATPMSGSPPK